MAPQGAVPPLLKKGCFRCCPPHLTRPKQKARYQVSAEFDDRLMIWIRRAGGGRHPEPPGPGGHCTRLGIRCSLCMMSRPYRYRALVIILLMHQNPKAQITLKCGLVFKQRHILNMCLENEFHGENTGTVSSTVFVTVDSAGIWSICCLPCYYSQILQRL